MSTLDVSTEDWTLWKVLLQSPEGHRRQVSVRCGRQDEAVAKALSVREFAGWAVAQDEYGNDLIWREAYG